MEDLGRLVTEGGSPELAGLDLLPTEEIARLMNREDARTVLGSITPCLDPLALPAPAGRKPTRLAVGPGGGTQ